MNNTAHIFNSKDGSLEARRAFRNVYEDWQNAEASRRFVDDDQWKESLGSKEEIRAAQKKNLLQTHENQELVSSQRQSERQSARDNQQSSDSSEQNQK